MATVSGSQTSMLNVWISDYTTQERRRAEIPAAARVDEVSRALVESLELPTRDAAARPQAYALFLRRSGSDESERLDPTAVIGDVLAEDAEISPHPEITPGVAR
jgi:hypothetical protein